MWYMMTALERRGRPIMYIRGLLVSWTGNFLGALFMAGVLSYCTETFTEEPFRSGIVNQVTTDIVEAKWHVIFLKAIGCGFLVRIPYIPITSATTADPPR